MPHDVDNPDSLDFALMRQREYERRMNLMQISRDPAQMDQIALDAASMIEDIFARGSSGGVTMRKAQVQILIRDLIENALVGGKPAFI